MKVIAVIDADFSYGALGLPAKLNEEILGETVLRRTLKRVLAAQRVDGVFLTVTPEQESIARQAATGLDVSVETHNAAKVPWHLYIASARKWALDGWRGGIGGATVFDEYLHPWICEALARREQADGVMSIPPAASLIDPELIDKIIEHFDTVRQDVRLAFTQSAPGLSAPLYMPALLADLAKIGQPPGRIMAYNPQDPRKDMLAQDCYCSYHPAVTQAFGRCIADTQTAIDCLTAILNDLGEANCDAISVSRWLTDHCYSPHSPLPAEIEIELTTEDPLVESKLRPRGKAVGPRGPLAEKIFNRLVEELATRQDTLVVLGGFGDPLMHPQCTQLVEHCRRASLFGVAIRTPAVILDEQMIQVLIDNRVDVLNVIVDAATAETYRRVHNADYFDRVMSNLENVIKAQRRAQQPQPLIVCEMLKTHDTMSEMESFYDHWLGKVGSAILTGPSHYSGQWPDLSVMPLAPPKRISCRRLFNRIMVLADGRVTACDQDFRGQHAIGSLANATLAQLWLSEAMNSIRDSHVSGTYDVLPLCAGCDEWHRP